MVTIWYQFTCDPHNQYHKIMADRIDTAQAIYDMLAVAGGYILVSKRP